MFKFPGKSDKSSQFKEDMVKVTMAAELANLEGQAGEDYLLFCTPEPEVTSADHLLDAGAPPAKPTGWNPIV
jgi:hypothetical protein